MFWNKEEIGRVHTLESHLNYVIDKQARAELDKLCKEADPTGRKANEPGAKLDMGKPKAALMLDGFGLALMEVAKVSTFGAAKYSPHGWTEVPEGVDRYRNAGDRHRLYRGLEDYDQDSKLLHLAHEAWNRLAELELKLRQERGDE